MPKRRHNSAPVALPEDDALIEYINSCAQPPRLRDVARAFHLEAELRPALRRRLRDLAESDQLNKQNQNPARQLEAPAETTMPEIGVLEIFGFDDDELENVIGKLLTKKKKTISVAESCSGGNISKVITSIPGSSNYFLGSIVAYSNDIKENMLGISRKLIERYGAVSEEVVEKMAYQIRKKFKSDIGISTSGIAGPSGGTKEKPVGTVWIGYSDKNKTVSKKLNLTERRDINIILSSL